MFLLKLPHHQAYRLGRGSNTTEIFETERKVYLVFPTAILHRLFEVFFISWLAEAGAVTADKQGDWNIITELHHHKDWAKPDTERLQWYSVSPPTDWAARLTLLKLLSDCPAVLSYLKLKFSRLKSAILIRLGNRLSKYRQLFKGESYLRF